VVVQGGADTFQQLKAGSVAGDSANFVQAVAELQSEGWIGVIEENDWASSNIGIVRGGTGSNVTMPQLYVLGECRSFDLGLREQVLSAWRRAFTDAVERANKAARGRGVTVHIKDCARVFELDPDRRIDVEWDPQACVLRKVKIRVGSKDEPGILAKVTKSISAAGINIGGVTVTTDKGPNAVQNFELWVNEVGTLNQVMKEIERVKGVLSVERVRG